MSVVNASLNLSGQGLVLVQGVNDDEDEFESNGSGKSVIFTESIVWAIFGETMRGYKGDKVVNRRVGKNTEVTLEIVDNGTVYRIERYRKHSKNKNHVLLFKNGQNITAKSDKDTDASIISLLQMDFSTFTNSVMFGQGSTKMFANATDSEQKKILENMLQIDIYRKCQDLSKEYLKSCVSDIDKLDSELSSAQNVKKSHEETVKNLQEKELNLKHQIESKIDSLLEEISEMKVKLDSLPDVDEILSDIERMKVDKGELENKMDEFKSLEYSANDLNSTIQVTSIQIKNLQKDIKDKTKQLNDIINGKNVPKTCYACGQPLPLEDTSHLENHLQDDIAKMREEMTNLHNEWMALKKLKDKVDTKLEAKKELEAEYERIREAIYKKASSVNVIENNRKSLENDINQNLKRIKEQEKLRDTTYTDIIEDTISKIEEINHSIQLGNQRMEELISLRKQYEFWVNGFGNQGIKSILLDSVVPFLNTRANYYVSHLAGSSIEITFDTQQELKSGEKRDKFSVNITNENGDNDYKGNSNGEKRRIDIAINMALQDLVMSRSNKKVDLIVYDEVFEGLDEVGCTRVIDLLEEKARSVGTIFVITHNPSLKQLFNNTVTVEKTGGETRLHV